MEHELELIYKKFKEVSIEQKKDLFISYCLKIIDYKNNNNLSIEEAAYKIVGILLPDSLNHIPEVEEIFDIAGDAEIPRETTYRQPMGEWNQKTADAIKEKEWSQLEKSILKLAQK